MGLRTRILKATQAALEDENAGTHYKGPAVEPEKPEDKLPSYLDDEDVSDFLQAARSREEPDLFRQLDAFAKDLCMEHPFRAQKFRQELRWILKRAKKHGVEWEMR
jgi:hypothetical protein